MSTLKIFHTRKDRIRGKSTAGVEAQFTGQVWRPSLLATATADPSDARRPGLKRHAAPESSPLLSARLCSPFMLARQAKKLKAAPEKSPCDSNLKKFDDVKSRRSALGMIDVNGARNQKRTNPLAKLSCTQRPQQMPRPAVAQDKQPKLLNDVGRGYEIDRAVGDQTHAQSPAEVRQSDLTAEEDPQQDSKTTLKSRDRTAPLVQSFSSWIVQAETTETARNEKTPFAGFGVSQGSIRRESVHDLSQWTKASGTSVCKTLDTVVPLGFCMGWVVTPAPVVARQPFASEASNVLQTRQRQGLLSLLKDDSDDDSARKGTPLSCTPLSSLASMFGRGCKLADLRRRIPEQSPALSSSQDVFKWVGRPEAVTPQGPFGMLDTSSSIGDHQSSAREVKEATQGCQDSDIGDRHPTTMPPVEQKDAGASSPLGRVMLPTVPGGEMSTWSFDSQAPLSYGPADPRFNDLPEGNPFKIRIQGPAAAVTTAATQDLHFALRGIRSITFE